MTDSAGNPTYGAGTGVSANPLRARAISLASKGYSVFPARVVRHPDGTKDVRPWDKWAENSTTDLETIGYWFVDGHTWTDVCIDCGKSGIVVVDLDVREDGDGREAWKGLLAEHDDGLLVAGRAKHLETPSGGRHLYFRNDPLELIGSRNDAWPHVDVKGAGGMVFAYGFVPKPAELPLRPAWLAERVRVVGGSERSQNVLAPADRPVAAVGPADPGQLTIPGEVRAFTRTQAEAFCASAWAALVTAPRGAINERLNIAAATFSHFVPAFWSEADVTAWLTEGQRQAWVAAGGRDDGDYGAAGETIRSGLGQTSDPWRAVLASDAPAAFGGPVGELPAGPPPPDAPAAQLDAWSAGLEALAAEFLDVDGLASLEPLEPLVRGVLFQRTLASITGAYGSLKTFVALDIALCVASGTSWHGREVHRGKVWYLLAEGVSGLRDRVSAWKEEWERSHDAEATPLDLSGFRVLPRAVQVKDDAPWAMLIELARRERPDLIVVDTKARFTAGYEENSASDTATVVARVDALKAASGGTALVVHHTGWSAERMRGSSAWGGALDTDILVEKRGDRTTPQAVISCPKQKDAEPFEPMTLQSRSVALGMDVAGEVVTSLAFEANAFSTPGPVDEQIAGALDVHEEQHPEVLADLVAVMESVAPSGSQFGRSQAEIRALMLLGGTVHHAVRRTASRGRHAGQRGYERAAIHQAFVLAAAYGWLEPAETPSKFTIRTERERSEALAEWRHRNRANADRTGESDRA